MRLKTKTREKLRELEDKIVISLKDYKVLSIGPIA